MDPFVWVFGWVTDTKDMSFMPDPMDLDHEDSYMQKAMTVACRPQLCPCLAGTLGLRYLFWPKVSIFLQGDVFMAL